MIEKLSLRIFWLFMVLCALTALAIIWLPGIEQTYERLIPTFFIIGLASFLIWSPIMVYRFYRIFDGE